MIFDFPRISLYFCNKYNRYIQSMLFQETFSYEKKYTNIRFVHLLQFSGAK